MPRLDSSWQNRQLSAAITISPASIISIPIVNTIPWTAVTIGLRQRFSSAKASTLPALFRLRPKEFWHIQPGGKVTSLRADNADPPVVRAVQKGESVRHLRHHPRAEGILLGLIVDDDFQHMTVHFGPNSPLGRLGLAHRTFS